MEDLALSDWPGQPVDLNGSNPWLPAYGFQQPMALLDKEDFLGHPDADLFLHGNASQHYVYLETIQEETSDDLRSDSDLSESRDSPVGWLATDSESGSVIRIHTLGQIESSSERELACPSKRRRQDLSNLSDDESNQESLSRSSSLIQFESLEKQCQDISSSSPSIFNNFSLDLDHQATRKSDPELFDKNFGDHEPESEYFKNILKIDGAMQKFQNLTGAEVSSNQNANHKSSRDSLFYNSISVSGSVRYSTSEDSSASDSTESEDTMETAKYDSCKSVNNLKTWRSFDGLHTSSFGRNKLSSENLSEDSGYSDHLFQNNSSRSKSSSIPNIVSSSSQFATSSKIERAGGKFGRNARGFEAYDFESFQSSTFTGNFGVSYQDLSILDKYEGGLNAKHSVKAAAAALNLEKECTRRSKYTQTSSEPNLPSLSSCAQSALSASKKAGRHHQYLSDCVLISSVPKDLNLAGSLWRHTNEGSIAAKNWDLINLSGMEGKKKFKKKSERMFNFNNGKNKVKEDDKRHYKREGSYMEAMKNMIDIGDGERNKARNPIDDFDRKILKAISEQSFNDVLFISNMANFSVNAGGQDRSVKSTPNLSVGDAEDRDEKEKRNSFGGDPTAPRKSSLANKSSTSSENDEKALLGLSTRSFSGSTSSKGVHFCPVVSEVNWRDDSLSTEREDSTTSSLSSNANANEEEPAKSTKNEAEEPGRKIIRPEPIRLTPRGDDEERFRPSSSQPELPVQVGVGKAETVNLRDKEYTFVPLRPRHSISQPNVSKGPRGAAETETTYYTDGDGVEYRHTLTASVVYNGAGAPTTAEPRVKEVEEPAAVSAMEPPVTGGGRSKKATKLGGFFSRLASFRFSSRKQHEEKKQQKKAAAAAAEKNVATGQRLAAAAAAAAPKPPDYIYIPLREAPPDGGGAAAVVTAKPPLPKSAPRVVGACVKRRPGAAASPAPPPPPEQRDGIDSAGGGGPMERPMGLIETDLDTEVTVITSGAHVKTRSLMNLGAEAPCCGLVAPQHPGRPHKSMEFLLDKQNLKVVERMRDRETEILTGIVAILKTIQCDIDEMKTANSEIVKSVRTLSQKIDNFEVCLSGGNVKGLELEKIRGIESILKREIDIFNRTLDDVRDYTKRNERGTCHRDSLLNGKKIEKENLVVKPPENELQKGERVMSEHQLRVQRSLQKLTVPDWYKQAEVPREGFLLKKSPCREARWTGTAAGSKTTSLSSLGSSAQSPVVLSPTPHGQPFVRWSTSKLNSTASSPCASTRSSFNARQPNGSISPSSLRSSFSYRQPYLGWRSQERLNRPRTPAERLASTILNSSQNDHHHLQDLANPEPQESPEIQTSIKEVTSAIVHYVSGLRPDESGAGGGEHGYESQETTSQRSRSASPRGSQKLCWLESSFVGTRPLDSPQTPVTLSESQTSTPVPPSSLRLELHTHNGESVHA